LDLVFETAWGGAAFLLAPSAKVIGWIVLKGRRKGTPSDGWHGLTAVGFIERDLLGECGRVVG
jgi:hypothetical protein